MLERLPDALLLVRDQGRGPRIGWANPAASALLGWDLAELSLEAPTVGRVAPTGDLERLLSPLRLGSGRIALLRRTGETVTASATAVPLPPDDGSSVWAVVLHDDDERMRARDQRQAELRLTALAQNLPIGIAFSEVGLRLGYVNDAMARTFGRTVDELLGVGWLDLLREADRERLVGLLESTPDGGDFEHVLRILRPDGDERWLSIKVVIIPVVDRASGFVATFEDVTDSRQREASLSWQAQHDALTGLGNRQQFDEALQQIVEQQGKRSGEATPMLDGLAVIFVDLDDFKNVNDRLGHEAGDQLLVEFAGRLRTATDAKDQVCRLGGDEFVVLCHDVWTDRACQVIADRLLDALRAPIMIGSGSVSLSASIGIMRADGTRTARDLLRAADSAMYAAKQNGKNRAYGPAQLLSAQVSVDPIRLLGSLRDTLMDGGLRVVYQPIRHLTSGRVLSVEALARWDGPDGPVPPSVFIPMAETAGLIGQLGEHVLRRACADLAEWRSQPEGQLPDRASVNVSAAQLADERFPDFVEQVLREYGLPPEALCLELTEQVAIADLTTGLATLNTLQELGVGLALDDFGTGYCSLTYLHQLPVSVLKLDRTFTAALDQPAAARVVRAMTRLGADLGLTVVAEGIERHEQAAALRRFGCRYGQGFLLGRPQGAGDLARELAETAIDAPGGRP